MRGTKSREGGIRRERCLRKTPQRSWNPEKTKKADRVVVGKKKGHQNHWKVGQARRGKKEVLATEPELEKGVDISKRGEEGRCQFLPHKEKAILPKRKVEFGSFLTVAEEKGEGTPFQ